MTCARLGSVALALLLALGTLAVPATAAPARDGGAVWTRDDPVVNPSKQPLVRDLGAGGTYTWSTPSVTGPLTVTNAWAHNWHWVGKVSWTEPPAQIVEGVSETLKITSEVTTKGTSGGIDVNAGWGWANGFGGSIPREQTAVCSGACGETATVDITMPVGQTYDKDHPENNPTLWVTVDGQTIFYARYSRSAPPPPPAVVVNPTPPPPDATVLDFCPIPAPDPNVSPPQPDPNVDGTAEMLSCASPAASHRGPPQIAPGLGACCPGRS